MAMIAIGRDIDLKKDGRITNGCLATLWSRSIKNSSTRGICTGTSHTGSSGNTFSTFPVFCAKEPAPGLVVNSPVRHDGIPISSPETSEQTEGGREGLNVECQPDANP
jgi:hypothetical protein